MKCKQLPAAVEWQSLGILLNHSLNIHLPSLVFLFQQHYDKLQRWRWLDSLKGQHYFEGNYLDTLQCKKMTLKRPSEDVTSSTL